MQQNVGHSVVVLNQSHKLASVGSTPTPATNFRPISLMVKRLICNHLTKVRFFHGAFNASYMTHYTA